jgi:hypothetical protein
MNKKRFTTAQRNAAMSAKSSRPASARTATSPSWESLVEEAKKGCDKITDTLRHDTSVQKGGRVYDCERQRCEWPICECKAKSA